MFRSQADPCYPENSQQDGCYPDNAGVPSRFMCWITGQAGSGQPDRGAERPRGSAVRPGNAERRAGRSRGSRH